MKEESNEIQDEPSDIQASSEILAIESAIQKKHTLYNPPSLKQLACETIKRTNPFLFFQLRDLALTLDIKNPSFIKPVIAQAEKEYLAKVKLRTEEVTYKTNMLANNCCFVKTMGFLGVAVFSSVYFGIVTPLLQAIDADAETVKLVYVLSLLCIILGGVAGIGMADKMAKLITECRTPQVSNKEIKELNEIVTEFHATPYG